MKEHANLAKESINNMKKTLSDIFTTETSKEKNMIKDAVHFPTDESSKSYTTISIKKIN